MDIVHRWRTSVPIGSVLVARRQLRFVHDGPLWPHVTRLLRKRSSPEQFAGTLRWMNPAEPTLQVSHQTIYTALYAMPQGELRNDACP